MTNKGGKNLPRYYVVKIDTCFSAKQTSREVYFIRVYMKKNRIKSLKNPKIILYIIML
jgi:hypothetical protein